MKVSDEVRNQVINYYIEGRPEDRLKLALSLVRPCQEYIAADGAMKDAFGQGNYLLQGGLRLLGRATLEGEDFTHLPVSVIDATISELDAPDLPALLRQVRDIVTRLKAAETERVTAEIAQLVRVENQEILRLLDDPTDLIERG